MFLVYPYALLLLIAVVPMVVMLRRRTVVAILSGLCLATAIFALARPIIFAGHPNAVSVMIVDAGPAADPNTLTAAQTLLSDQANPQSNPTKLIAYSNRAAIIQNLHDLASGGVRAELDAPLWPDDSASGGSALADALRLAGAQIPAGAEGRILVIGNGIQTRGDAEAEAYRLARRGIRISVNPVGVNANHANAIIRDVSLPPTARRGETVLLRLNIEAIAARDATLTIAIGQAAPLTRAVALPMGMSAISFPVALHENGNVAVRVALNDAPPIRAGIFVTNAGTILVVEPTPTSGAAAALAAILGDSAIVESVGPDALTPQNLQSAAAVALCDVPASELPAAAQNALLEAVNHGTGLLVSGAARSFGPGGYDSTSLAAALPLQSDEKIQQIDPSVGVVLIIDTSGSMYGPKLDLAKEMSRLVISHLRPQDKLGVIEFYAGMRWAAPLQPVGDGQQINRAIGRLTAGGDNLLYPAIEEAGDALENIRAKGKHILIMSDGFVEFSPFAALAQSLGEEGISISGAACMPAPGDRNVMPDLARWGNGHYYNVVDRFNIPDIRFKEPRPSPISPVVRAPAAVEAGDDALARLSGVASLPPIDGYVRTRAKSTSDILLKAADGSPLLARWRYGRGYVAALPTQLGSEMSKGLQDNPAFAKLVTALFRQLTSSTPAQPFEIKTKLRPAGIEISADWSGPASTAPQAVDILLTGGGAAQKQSALAPVRPGQWNALYAGVTAGDYTVTADGSGARAQVAIALNAPRLFPRLSADARVLDRLASISSDASLGQHENIAAARVIELRDLLIPGVVLLLIVQIAARRWPATN